MSQGGWESSRKVSPLFQIRSIDIFAVIITRKCSTTAAIAAVPNRIVKQGWLRNTSVMYLGTKFMQAEAKGSKRNQVYAAGARPKEVAAKHHNTLEVMCAQKPFATQSGPSKQVSSFPLARQRPDHKAATLSPSCKISPCREDPNGRPRRNFWVCSTGSEE